MESSKGLEEVRLEQWDVPFYMARAREARQGSGASPHAAAVYFPLRRCVHGLVLLCRQLFGVDITLEDAPAHESWCGSGDQQG